MAKIPLRSYIKEIENQIERGEIEQAIGHAKNILKAYPKNIDTYRLLGKAFLESQRYSEAADILQRVLSVLPDDFISQIGMSIIREDEGNLDAAIWHMERAYEVQPFNPAVQEELRRLYGRRDGIEPPKIRLTRGALVRMYARGELYAQAIAETRAALAEDPQRFDLLVLLARLYYLSGHKNDAAEVCSELLRKLPYCYEANQLLAQFLPSTNRADEAQKFLQRIYALDPYAAFISPTAPTSDQVPDQAVMVEQFTWESALEEAHAPEWARNVGVAWEETPEENLPDWLNTLKPEAPTSQTGTLAQGVEAEPPQELASAEAPQDEVIPDWMKDAGWIPSDRKADDVMAEAAASGAFDDENAEILPGELPDWIQSIAPQETKQAPEEDERTDWLETILSEPEGDLTKDSGIVPPPQPEKDESQQGLPDWVTGAGTGTQIPSDQKADDLPDWFSQLDGENHPADIAPIEEPKPADFSGLPDWSQLGEPAVSESTADADQTPDWLKSFDVSETSAASAAESAETEQAPDWLQSFETQAPSSAEGNNGGVTDWLQSAEPASAEPEPGNIPDWLQALSPEETVPQQPEIEQPLDENLVSAASDILAGFETADTLEPFAQETAAPSQPEAAFDLPMVEDAAAVPTAGAVEELPAAQAAPEPTAEGAMPDFSDMDSAMAWLESLAAKQGADEATLVTPPEQRLETPPDWVTKEMENAEPAAPQADVESPAETAEVAGDLPDWLQSGELESEQPAAVETEAYTEAPAAPAESAADLPDWLQGMDETTIPQETTEIIPDAQAATPAEAGMPDLSDMDSAMAWLESLAAKQGADEATLVTPPEQRLDTPPDWVTRELESPEQSVTEPAVAETPVEAEPAAAEQPAEEAFSAVVEDFTMPEASLPEATLEPTMDWLEPAESAAPVETVPPVAEQSAQPDAAMPDFSDMDAAMAWLESLAAKQGADEATLVTPPDQRLETPPDWITKEMEVHALDEQASVELPAAEEAPVETTTNDAASFDAAVLDANAFDEILDAAVRDSAATAEAEAAPEVELPAAEEAVLPDWLQDAIPDEAAISEHPAAISEQPAAVQGEAQVIAEPGTTVPAEMPTIETPAESPAVPDFSDMDAAMAWLESLAAKQGADEATLVTPPEQRLENPPDWVQQQKEAAAAAAEARVEEEPPVEAEAAQFEEHAPIAESLGMEPVEEEPLVEETTVFETPTYEETPPALEMPAEFTAEAAAEEEAANVPDWLSSIGQDETAEATAWPGATEAVSEQAVSSEEMPDWLKQPAMEEPAAETSVPPLQPAAEEEPVPDWLKDLEAGEAEEFTGSFPQEAEMPVASVDFRSAWEPEVEVEISQPAANAPVEALAPAGSLREVQGALNQGDLDRALAGYNSFIQSGAHLDETIHDLRDALYRYPVDISIWQTLGDAYARNNQLQEALDAYTKAEELLR